MKGTVKEMSLVSTTVLTFNNEKLIIPNNKIWGGIIQNITSEEKRRIDFVFPVGHDADIEQTERILHSIVEKHELILSTPEPIIHLHKLDESSVKFIVRPWVVLIVPKVFAPYLLLQREKAGGNRMQELLG